MKIVLLEPFFTGSHKRWALELKKYSSFEITILSLPGHHWKWRMHGGAISLANQYLKKIDYKPDLIIATSLLDLSVFQALTKEKTHDIKFALYFHENQFAYPWSEKSDDKKYQRDVHYQFIQFSSALCADRCFFNSQFNKESFFNGCEQLLRSMPDDKNLDSLIHIKQKSLHLPLGLDLSHFRPQQSQRKIPTIVWNHRWEYDKNPQLFFRILYKLKLNHLPFNLMILGQKYSQSPDCFEKAKIDFADQIVHYGQVSSTQDYLKMLQTADIALTTSNQDFFGYSVVEAMASGCHTVLPKALAYPEHFPDEQGHFYQTEAEAYQIMEKLIKNHPQNTLPSHHLNNYHWPQLISVYEKEFSKI